MRVAWPGSAGRLRRDYHHSGEPPLRGAAMGSRFRQELRFRRSIHRRGLLPGPERMAKPHRLGHDGSGDQPAGQCSRQSGSGLRTVPTARKNADCRRRTRCAPARVLIRRAGHRSGDLPASGGRAASTSALEGVRKEAPAGQRTTIDVLNAQQDLMAARGTPDPGPARPCRRLLHPAGGDRPARSQPARAVDAGLRAADPLFPGARRLARVAHARRTVRSIRPAPGGSQTDCLQPIWAGPRPAHRRRFAPLFAPRPAAAGQS